MRKESKMDSSEILSSLKELLKTEPQLTLKEIEEKINEISRKEDFAFIKEN